MPPVRPDVADLELVDEESNSSLSNPDEKRIRVCGVCTAKFRSVPDWDRCRRCRHREVFGAQLIEAVSAGAALRQHLENFERVVDAISAAGALERKAEAHRRLVDGAAAANVLDIELDKVIDGVKVDKRADESPEYPGWARWQRYGEDWPEQRQKVLERDDYECQECGLSQEEHKRRDDLFPPGKGLHIHHETPFREFDSPEEANRIENLVALCHLCHTRAE